MALQLLERKSIKVEASGETCSDDQLLCIDAVLVTDDVAVTLIVQDLIGAAVVAVLQTGN